MFQLHRGFPPVAPVETFFYNPNKLSDVHFAALGRVWTVECAKGAAAESGWNA